MFTRQTSGSVVCPGCGVLVGVNDETCYNCGRWNPGLWGFAPVLRRLGQDMGFTQLVIGTCIILYGFSLILSEGVRTGGMSFFGPDSQGMILLGASGSYPVFDLGFWWTPLSAGWLHAGVLHILFNMMWVRQLAPATAELYGPARAVIIYTVAGVCGFAASTLAGVYMASVPIFFLQGGQLTVGASAPIFGMLGALVYYGRRGGSRMLGAEAWRYAGILFVFGLIMPGVDNYAHAGGFGGGYLMSRWLDPLTRERVDHVLVAFVCLLLTFVAVLASLLSGLKYVLPPG